MRDTCILTSKITEVIILLVLCFFLPGISVPHATPNEHSRIPGKDFTLYNVHIHNDLKEYNAHVN